MQFLFWWIVAISIVAICITVKDKYAAKQQQWRIPERTLLTVALLGGSVAMFITMQIVRHKTKKAKFTVGIPLIILLQAAIFLLSLR